ncbi:hypothetical protein [Hydrogenophaga sp.]|uniref:hypothetical protein n=1 Tax=Hydrogenophaga sp. TaxID=1904254 RepID=UPI00271C8618|nr:hypothetical protein [Hydrogenophaga sp.]MDO8904625.1 hypothetical protein [Hydrogenophaga sp.]
MRQVSSPQPMDSAFHAHRVVDASTRCRQPAPAQAWPADLLKAFCLRMSSQGMCVSQVLMQNDRRYGLEQLSHAHNMADDTLRAMAVQLFRHFEAYQSGISDPH